MRAALRRAAAADFAMSMMLMLAAPCHFRLLRAYARADAAADVAAISPRCRR